MTVALGSDWSPSGSRNLLAELKVARIVNASLSPKPYTDREIVAMATRNPATMLGWGDAIGSLADDHFADFLVVAGTDGDPYDHLLTASERDVALVVVDGVARFGRPSLMEALDPGAAFETVRIDGLDRRLFLTEAAADPIVGGLTLAAARSALTNALANLAALAKLLEDPPPGAALAALSDPTPQWFLELAQDEPAGLALRPHLPGPDGQPTAVVEMPLAAAAKPLSKLLVPMTLDPLTVSDDAGYWARHRGADDHPRGDPDRVGGPRRLGFSPRTGRRRAPHRCRAPPTHSPPPVRSAPRAPDRRRPDGRWPAPIRRRPRPAAPGRTMPAPRPT